MCVCLCVMVIPKKKKKAVPKTRQAFGANISDCCVAASASEREDIVGESRMDANSTGFLSNSSAGLGGGQQVPQLNEGGPSSKNAE